VRYDTVPADASNAVAIMKVGLSGFEEFFLLGDILDQNFRATSGKQVFFVGIEFNRADRSTSVNLSRTDTTTANFQRLACLPNDLRRRPKRNSAIGHASCDNAHFIELVGPVKTCKARWTFGQGNFT